jgi:hypothetical protein
MWKSWQGVEPSALVAQIHVPAMKPVAAFIVRDFYRDSLAPKNFLNFITLGSTTNTQ